MFFTTWDRFENTHQHDALEIMSLSTFQSLTDMPFGAVLFGAACGSGGVGLRFGSVWDFARAFRVQLEDLGPGIEQNVSVVLELLKNGGIFHELFYPALPEDDGEDGESVEDEPAGDAET
ncbi:hypothetical protein AK812_SmicGene766 [Symbiodinium microadriaticum]|uniref:Uncharacterized protein n=1 Tax=Symbiodinium microadriaticum TaxID=2951 RepID=A0A1Q9F5V3_SYMMI|nr:hypothetical protein AK812_SmicGene766 [Symbiodinium microadriaticum]